MNFMFHVSVYKRYASPPLRTRKALGYLPGSTTALCKYYITTVATVIIAETKRNTQPIYKYSA